MCLWSLLVYLPRYISNSHHSLNISFWGLMMCRINSPARIAAMWPLEFSNVIHRSVSLLLKCNISCSTEVILLRTRSRGSLSDTCLMYGDSFPLSCANRIWSGITTYGPVANFKTGESWVITDQVTPDYWKRRKRGEFILNDLYTSHTTCTASGNSEVTHTSVANYCTGPDLKQTGRYRGSFFVKFYADNVGPPTNTALTLERTVQDLMTENWTGCLADRQKGIANLVESIAELEKTFAMLHKPLVNVQKLIKDLRAHGKRKKGYEKVRAQSRDYIAFVSSEWLRFRYGVSPLMSDVKAIMKTLKHEFDAQKPRILKTRKNLSSSATKVTPGSATASPFKLTWQVSQAHQVTIRATHFDKGTPSAFDMLGLTFHNIVGVPWELTRYSFVVDWFANVGDLIYANLPRVGISSLGGVQTTREIITSFYYPTGMTNVNPGTWTLGGAPVDTYLMVYDYKERRVMGDFGTGLVIKDDFRLDNYVRAADAATLLSQWLHTIGF